MRRNLALPLLPLATALALAACDAPGVRVEDDLDFELFTARLHTPYVVGAGVRLRAWHSDEAVDPSGWSGALDDAAVLRLDGQSTDPGGLRLDCRAVGPGETTLTIRDAGGSRLAVRTIEVARPDRLELVPAGLIKVHGDDADALDLSRSLPVLVGGTATFEVRYYQGDRRLFGNGALDATPVDATITAEVEETYLFENREWLQVTVSEPGPAGVALYVAGTLLGTLTVEGVEEDVIASVTIEAETERGADDDELLYLLARARDADGQDVWGVDFDWTVDGLPDPETGDLYYYYYDADAGRLVSASRNGQSDELTVHFTEGGVTSSNDLGCSAAGGATGLALPLLAAFLLLARRRRRA